MKDLRLTIKENNIKETELKRCKESPLYFMNKFMRLRDNNQSTKFKATPFQEAMLASFSGEGAIPSIDFFKRGTGKTTINAMYIVWYALFNDKSRLLVLCDNRQEKDIFLRKVIELAQDVDKKAPFDLNVTYMKSYSEIIFPNESKIFGVSMRDAEYLRGYNPDLLCHNDIITIGENALFYIQCMRR
jgi:hypothetical protein